MHLVLISGTLLTLSCRDFSGRTASGEVVLTSDVKKTIPLDSSPQWFSELHNARAVQSYYKGRNFLPAWWEDSVPSQKADTLMRFIERIRLYGLRPQHYHFLELKKRLSDSAFNDQNVRQRIDLLLTDAFLSIANDIRHGTKFKQPDSLLALQLDSTSVALLNSAMTTNELSLALVRQQPLHPQYVHLRNELQKLIAQADAERQSFLLAGGVPDTLSRADTVQLLEINLQRWREERSSTDRFILVNIPSYQLEIFERDSIVFESSVIVGSPKNRTPMLDGLLRSFMIFPYWNVPRSIAVNEILPQAKKDSLYLQNHHYEILDVNETVLDPMTVPWMDLGKNNFPYTIRQKEGMHNALGLVKFWFNNPYDVYLHDTNARYLFSKEKRALSHGCVRVHKAMELARHLLEGNDVVSPEDLDQYVELQQQTRIKADAIEVRFRYFTAAYIDGVVKFYDDIYGYDGEYVKLMYDTPPVRTEEKLNLLTSMVSK
jgi:L,D-transpeptidase YcbB